jgi:hypothetical protein
VLTGPAPSNALRCAQRPVPDNRDRSFLFITDIVAIATESVMGFYSMGKLDLSANSVLRRGRLFKFSIVPSFRDSEKMEQVSFA